MLLRDYSRVELQLLNRTTKFLMVTSWLMTQFVNTLKELFQSCLNLQECLKNNQLKLAQFKTKLEDPLRADISHDFQQRRMTLLQRDQGRKKAAN